MSAERNDKSMAVTPCRPAATYLHGLDGPVVATPAWFALWLEQHTDLPRQRVALRGVNPAVDEVLLALHHAAMHVPSSATASVTGSAPPRLPEVRQELPLTPNEVAERAGVTGRAVRQAITAGRLHAHRSGHRWFIDRADAENYRRNRAA